MDGTLGNGKMICLISPTQTKFWSSLSRRPNWEPIYKKRFPSEGEVVDRFSKSVPTITSLDLALESLEGGDETMNEIIRCFPNLQRLQMSCCDRDPYDHYESATYQLPALVSDLGTSNPDLRSFRLTGSFQVTSGDTTPEEQQAEVQVAMDALRSIPKLELIHIMSEDGPQLASAIFVDMLLNGISDFTSLKDIEIFGAVSEHTFQIFTNQLASPTFMQQLEKVEFGALFSINHVSNGGTGSFPLPLMLQFEHSANARLRIHRFHTHAIQDLLLPLVLVKRPITQFEFPNNDLLIHLSQNYALLRERPDLIPSR